MEDSVLHFKRRKRLRPHEYVACLQDGVGILSSLEEMLAAIAVQSACCDGLNFKYGDSKRNRIIMKSVVFVW